MGLLLALYVLEIAGVVAALAVHRYYNLLNVLTIRQAIIILASLTICVTAGVYVVRCYLRARLSGTKQFIFPLVTNLLGVALLLVAGETMVRVFSVRPSSGVSFAGTILLPKSWEDVRARNAELLRAAPSSNISYFVNDRLLGWTVGPSRRSPDGLYLSSAEGIRSPRAGMKYADHSASRRIAIVGDSFTFGMEVSFQDSWASALERALGTEFAMLNFGVDGYGVDQAYLRYDRDVRSWRPSVTIFGFIDDDLYRSMVVYPFIRYPHWGFPFSKPRFVPKAGKLELLNAPLISPTEILQRTSITELPFVTYDLSYNADEWERHAYDWSYFLRFVFSRYSRWPRVNAQSRDEELHGINGALLLNFTRRATTEGTIPLVVYFPSRGDFAGQDRTAKDGVLAVLRRSGVAYLDLTSCIDGIGWERAFIAGRPHYSAEGNAAVARCLLPVIRTSIGSR